MLNANDLEYSPLLAETQDAALWQAIDAYVRACGGDAGRYESNAAACLKRVDVRHRLHVLIDAELEARRQAREKQACKVCGRARNDHRVRHRFVE